jgi:hypothetical protein
MNSLGNGTHYSIILLKTSMHVSFNYNILRKMAEIMKLIVYFNRDQMKYGHISAWYKSNIHNVQKIIKN